MPVRSENRIFEQARPALLGLAYRILGSHADAEDAVQDTFLKWQNADRGTIDNPRGWLTTACTRRAIDMLRTLRRAGIAVPLAVNAPASTLSDERAVDFLLGRIHAAELPASLLRVELTEDQPIRELDVLRGVLEGQTAHEIGETIGVKASSVVTYQKRAYRRLGISSQRQLFALCLQP